MGRNYVIIYIDVPNVPKVLPYLKVCICENKKGNKKKELF